MRPWSLLLGLLALCCIHGPLVSGIAVARPGRQATSPSPFLLSCLSSPTGLTAHVRNAQQTPTQHHGTEAQRLFNSTGMGHAGYCLTNTWPGVGRYYFDCNHEMSHLTATIDYAALTVRLIGRVAGCPATHSAQECRDHVARAGPCEVSMEYTLSAPGPHTTSAHRGELPVARNHTTNVIRCRDGTLRYVRPGVSSHNHHLQWNWAPGEHGEHGRGWFGQPQEEGQHELLFALYCPNDPATGATSTMSQPGQKTYSR